MSMIGNLLRVSKEELEAYLKDSSVLEQRLYNDLSKEDEHLTDIEKSWDGIIYLLTGQPLSNAEGPLVKVLFSGQLIDQNQDLGYGPAHYLIPEQVEEINNQISKITPADLKRNFVSDKMNEADVYPEIWDQGEEAFEYLSEYFEVVKKVYSQAAQNRQAIITFIN